MFYETLRPKITYQAGINALQIETKNLKTRLITSFFNTPTCLFTPRGLEWEILEIEESTWTLKFEFASAVITVPHSSMSLEDDIHEDRKS